MTVVDDIKGRIALKARELFIQFGIRHLSMDELASELGMSKKTIYNYYKDKEEIVMTMLQLKLDKGYDEHQLWKQKAKNAIHESFMAIDQTYEIFSRMNPSTMFDLQKYHPNAYQAFISYKNKFLYDVIKNNLEWGIKDGLFRSDINVELIVRYRLESMLLAFVPEIYMNVDMGVGKTHEQLFYLFLYGIATPKGYQMINKYRKERIKNSNNDKN
jgi:AcrR family transcriptional regulator